MRIVLYLQTQTWFPTSGGVTLPGVTAAAYFVIIVFVMFWRGAALPERGAIVEQRLPAAPASRHRLLPVLLGAVGRRHRLHDDGAGLPAGDDQQPDRRRHLPLVCNVITGFVGQISLVQLALAGVGGYTVSKLAADAGFPFRSGR